MSIIHDALKKIEGSKQEKPVSKFKLYSAYALVFFIGIIAAKLGFDFFFPVSSKAKAPVPLAKTAAPLAKTAAPVLKNEAAKPSGIIRGTSIQPTFVLNGKFASGDSCYALINNKIVEVGDTVDGAQVVSITAESVQLKSGDQLINLK